MKEKKYAKLTVGLLAGCLLLIAGFNFLIDPFEYYRMPQEPLKFIPYAEMDQNLNLARNAKYDAVITGTSMTENFQSSWFNKQFDCNAIKLPFAGGATKDFLQLFDEVYQSGQDIKYIFYGIDVYSLAVKVNTTKFTYDTYQISKNPFYDTQYLLNKDIFLEYSMNSLIQSFSDSSLTTEIPDNMYCWDSDSITYGKEAVLKSYNRPSISEQSGNSYGDVVSKNLSSMTELVSLHPETEFYLFFPPYSILYWDSMIRSGDLEKEFDALTQACEQFLKYENVHVYGFIMDQSVITDFDNYKDYSHYSSEINQWIANELGGENHLLTRDNYSQVLEEFHTFVLDYDYESIFR